VKYSSSSPSCVLSLKESFCPLLLVAEFIGSVFAELQKVKIVEINIISSKGLIKKFQLTFRLGVVGIFEKRQPITKAQK
jgi:hypothetical protein